MDSEELNSDVEQEWNPPHLSHTLDLSECVKYLDVGVRHHEV